MTKEIEGVRTQTEQGGRQLQVGAYVPADRVVMSVVDSVFTRMGASDNLAQGRSTFLEVCSSSVTPLPPSCLLVMMTTDVACSKACFKA